MGSRSPLPNVHQQRILTDLTKLEQLAKSFDNAPLAETLGCMITAHQMVMYGFEFVSVPPEKRRGKSRRTKSPLQPSPSSTT